MDSMGTNKALQVVELFMQHSNTLQELPENILANREKKLRNEVPTDYFIQWKDLPAI